MPLMIFWLTPIVLLIIFLLVIFHQRPNRRGKIFLVEPLLFLVNRWHLARFEGNETVLRKLLSYWLPGLEMQRSIAEQLVRQIITAPPLFPDKTLAVISQKSLPFWAEERLIEVAGKKVSTIIGPASEVIDYCDADADGLLTQEKRIAWPAKAGLAYRNGFLALAIAESSSSDALLRKKYRLVGLVILEPTLDASAVAKLRQAEGLGKIRYLSVLSADLVEQLINQIFPKERWQKTSGESLSVAAPKEQERVVDETEIFGEVGKKDRYYIARHFQRQSEVNLISNIPLDDDLAADRRI